MEPIDQQLNNSYNPPNEDITADPLHICNTLTFSNIKVEAEHFTNIEKHVDVIAINRCISNDWAKVLYPVASFLKVKELSITNCRLRDENI
jgi:hypothetical protein